MGISRTFTTSTITDEKHKEDIVKATLAEKITVKFGTPNPIVAHLLATVTMSPEKEFLEKLREHIPAIHNGQVLVVGLAVSNDRRSAKVVVYTSHDNMSPVALCIGGAKNHVRKAGQELRATISLIPFDKEEAELLENVLWQGKSVERGDIPHEVQEIRYAPAVVGKPKTVRVLIACSERHFEKMTEPGNLEIIERLVGHRVELEKHQQPQPQPREPRASTAVEPPDQGITPQSQVPAQVAPPRAVSLPPVQAPTPVPAAAAPVATPPDPQPVPPPMPQPDTQAVQQSKATYPATIKMGLEVDEAAVNSATGPILPQTDGASAPAAPDKPAAQAPTVTAEIQPVAEASAPNAGSANMLPSQAAAAPQPPAAKKTMEERKAAIKAGVTKAMDFTEKHEWLVGIPISIILLLILQWIF